MMVVLLYAVYFFYYPVMEYVKQSRFDTEVQGVLLNYEAQKTLYQGYEGGTHTTIKNYIAHYRYQINDKTYHGRDILPGKTAVGLALKQILNSPNKVIKIKYKSKMPTESIVDL